MTARGEDEHAAAGRLNTPAMRAPADLGGDYSPPSWLIGHRGARAIRLENSLDAFRWAVDHRVRVIEMDLRLTADNVLVCSHDPTLLRLFGRDRRVGGTTAAELSAIDPYTPSAVPRADDALDAIEHRARVVLEMKPDSSGSIPETLLALLERRRAAGRQDDILCISSFDHAAVRELLDLAPSRLEQLALLVSYRESLTSALSEAARLSISWVHPHYTGLLREPWGARLARRRGITLATYTVNSPRLVLLMRTLGAEYVFTDDPYLLDPRRATS